jgi:hypothetical protein
MNAASASKAALGQPKSAESKADLRIISPDFSAPFIDYLRVVCTFWQTPMTTASVPAIVGTKGRVVPTTYGLCATHGSRLPVSDCEQIDTVEC